jgi:thiamine biosynthesis protein ThiS
VVFFGASPAAGGIASVHIMNITLNGEKKEVPEGISVVGLLEFLKIQHQRVAVELNTAIVKKDRYGDTPIQEGDNLEVVSFMGGGASNVECGMRSAESEGKKTGVAYD